MVSAPSFFFMHQAKKVFRTFFVAMTKLVLARAVDPVTAQQVVVIMGMGVCDDLPTRLSFVGDTWNSRVQDPEKICPN